MRFQDKTPDGANAAIDLAQGPGSGDVETISLDDVVAGNQVFCMKVDVEGFELRALRSAFQSFQQQLVHNIIVEFGPPRRWQEAAGLAPSSGLNVLDSMHAFGYDMHIMPSFCSHRVSSAVGTKSTRHGIEVIDVQPQDFEMFIQHFDQECYVWWTVHK